MPRPRKSPSPSTSDDSGLPNAIVAAIFLSAILSPFLIIYLVCFRTESNNVNQSKKEISIPRKTNKIKVKNLTVKAIIKTDKTIALSTLVLEGMHDIDSNQLYPMLFVGEPSGYSPPEADPFIVVINKHEDKYTYFKLTQSIKSVRLKNQDTQDVTLLVKKENPLQIQLWINVPKDVEIYYELKGNIDLEIENDSQKIPNNAQKN